MNMHVHIHNIGIHTCTHTQEKSAETMAAANNNIAVVRWYYYTAVCGHYHFYAPIQASKRELNPFKANRRYPTP